jgi:two-component system chemotaxis sensor kinase CheA
MEAPGPDDDVSTPEAEPDLPAAPPSVPAITQSAPEASATAEAMPIAESKAARRTSASMSICSRT